MYSYTDTYPIPQGGPWFPTPPPSSSASSSSSSLPRLCYSTAAELFEARIKGSSLRRVALLKHIDQKVTHDAFKAAIESKVPDAGKRGLISRVIFESNLSGVTEGSAFFYELLQRKCERMALCRSTIRHTLDRLGDASGFNAFERALITGCSRISDEYDNYWVEWTKAVSHPAVVAALNDSSDVTQKSRAACSHLLSPYTVPRVQIGDGGYLFRCEPYAVFFSQVLQPVLSAFDACIAALVAVAGGAGPKLEGQESATIAFLRQFRVALSERNVDRLDAQWTACDSKWMDCKGPLQVGRTLIHTSYMA